MRHFTIDRPRVPSLTQRSIDRAIASARRPEPLPRYYVSLHGLTLEWPHFSFTTKDAAMDFADDLFAADGRAPTVFALFSDGLYRLWDHPGAYSYQS